MDSIISPQVRSPGHICNTLQDGNTTHQLPIRPALDDLPVLEHDDALRARDRRQPVRDHEARRLSRPQDLVDRIVDAVLRCRVQRARRLVQREDCRLLQQRTRDRQPLALSARER